MVETCAGRSERVLVGRKGSWCVENGCWGVERGRKWVLVSRNGSWCVKTGPGESKQVRVCRKWVLGGQKGSKGVKKGSW